MTKKNDDNEMGRQQERSEELRGNMETERERESK